MAEEQYQPGQHPDLPPPIVTVGIVGWVRTNLLSGPVNILLTALALYILWLTVPPLIDWAVTSAVISGQSRQVCDLGRQAGGLGESIARADLAHWDAETTQDALQSAQDYLGEFAGRLAKKGTTVPADLAPVLASLDPAPLSKDLQDAVAKQDVPRIKDDFVALAPIVTWGRAHDGACWTYVKVWFGQFVYGRYPADQRWRINLAFLILVAGMVPLFLERVRGKLWIVLFLLLVYPVIALYLFGGLSHRGVADWPYRFVGWSGVLLGITGLLPFAGALRARQWLFAIILLVLLPLWGVAAIATWTGGVVAAAPTWTTAVAVILSLFPPLALAASLYSRTARQIVLSYFWQFSLLAGLLAFVGIWFPILSWTGAATAPPPAMAFAVGGIAIAALSPWGFDEEGGGPDRLARILLPLYVLLALMAIFGAPSMLGGGVFDWGTNTHSLLLSIADVLPVVDTPEWGGLFLTMLIGGVGILFSLPIGIVLALGRRSHMPIVRAICVAFIELWRGVPLISVLFMASVMFPLFLPEGMNFDKLIRALLGVVLFASAYQAEVVRGGLQAIPKGQYEAAQAMGLSYWKMTGLVILPQALKLVIPAIVNTFNGLFKDTTLVLIIGLFDLLGMVQSAATNPNWLGFATEGYVTAAVGFWIICFALSRYSIYIERRLETGHRR